MKGGFGGRRRRQASPGYKGEYQEVGAGVSFDVRAIIGYRRKSGFGEAAAQFDEGLGEALAVWVCLGTSCPGLYCCETTHVDPVFARRWKGQCR